MGSFAADVRKFAHQTGISLDVVVRKVTFDLHAEIVRLTPVDTGMARTNWQIGLNSRPTGTIIEAVDRGAGRKGSSRAALVVASREAGKVNQIRAGGINYIVNNMPYIMRLEYGSSRQAPQGMARRTVATFQAIVNRVVRGVAR